MDSERTQQRDTGDKRSIFWSQLERRRVPPYVWLAGLVLLTAVLVGPRLSQRVSASSTPEVPDVTVRTLTGPDSEPGSEGLDTAEPPADTVSGVEPADPVQPPRVQESPQPERGPRSDSRTYRTPEPPERTVSAPEPRRVSPRRRRSYARANTGAESRMETEQPAEPAVRPRRLRTRSASTRARTRRSRTARTTGTREWSLVQQGEGRFTLKRPAPKAPDRTLAEKVAEAYRKAGEKPAPAKPPAGTPEERSAAPSPVKSAVAPIGWRQSTDRREEAWFREKREALATPISPPTD